MPDIPCKASGKSSLLGRVRTTVRKSDSTIVDSIGKNNQPTVHDIPHESSGKSSFLSRFRMRV